MKRLLAALLLLLAAAAGEPLVCGHCGKAVADTGAHLALPEDPAAALAARHEPALGADGRVFTFANPHGVRQDLALFSEATGLSPNAVASAAHSYFDGYVWRSVHCDRCGRHLGFAFEHGTLHRCAMDVLDAKVLMRRKKLMKAVTSASAASRGEPDVVEEAEETETEPEPQEDPGDVVDLAVNQRALTLKRGWWTYELAHRGTLTQVHVDGTDPIPAAAPRGNLGVYEAADAVRPAANRLSVVHRFGNGDVCDETGEPRAAEVQYVCCDSDTKARRKPHVKSVVEPTLCFYRVTVCVPRLCELDGFSALHPPCPVCGKRLDKARFSAKQFAAHVDTCEATGEHEASLRSMTGSGKAAAKVSPELAKAKARLEAFDEKAERASLLPSAMSQCEAQMADGGMRPRFVSLLWDEVFSRTTSHELAWTASVSLVTSVPT